MASSPLRSDWRSKKSLRSRQTESVSERWMACLSLSFIVWFRWLLREYEKLRRSSVGLTFDSISGWLNSHLGLIGEKTNIENQIKRNETFRQSNEITDSMFKAIYNQYVEKQQEVSDRETRCSFFQVACRRWSKAWCRIQLRRSTFHSRKNNSTANVCFRLVEFLCRNSLHESQTTPSIRSGENSLKSPNFFDWLINNVKSLCDK